MSLLGKWRPGLWRSRLEDASRREVSSETVPVSGLRDLQTRLDRWSHLWTQENESASRTEAQQLVAERLAQWMERCFGQHVVTSVRGKDSRISLATSIPIFTALLGRRATRELSRRVLQDI